MKIKHFKGWINTLPEECDEYEMVFRVVIGKSKEGMIAKDNNIDACGIDADNNEAYLCNETTHSIIEKNTTSC
jgi:hypothetical protein